MSPMTRKELFHAAFGRLSGACAGAGGAAEPNDDPFLAALAGDFSDALLAEEARRLGLDPARCGREEMLRAVAAAMRAPSRQEV